MTRHSRTKQVVARLARIEGHVGAIRRMVAQDRACSDVLLQVAAVRAALDRVGKIILANHMEHCLVDLGRDGQARKHLAELRKALERFMR